MNYAQPLIDGFNQMGANRQQDFENQRAMAKDAALAEQMARQAQMQDRQMRLSDLEYADKMKERDYQTQEQSYMASQKPAPVNSLYASASPAAQAFIKAESGAGSDIQPPQEAKHPFRLQMEFAQQQGNTEKINALHGMALKRAVEMSALTGKGEAAAQEYNKMTGENIQYIGVTKDRRIVLKKDEQLLDIDPMTGETKVIAEGKDSPVKSEYKTRTYNSGATEITEESKDGGQTWSKVATAPRYKPNSGGGGHGNGQPADFKNETVMRKEFLNLPEVKDFPTVESSSKRAVKALSEQGKGSNVAVDQSIITVFNKMLDPTSVVRESEYARTPGDLSILSRIRGKWDKVQQGGAGLDSKEREALARMVTAFANIAGQQYNEQVANYTDIAERYGYDPRNIIRLGGKTAPDGKTPANPVVTKPGAGLKADGKGGFIWRP